jgi:outer membrane immunogenic protein
LSTANGNVAFFNNGRRGPGEFLGTVRGRLGYAIDTVLVYATGGFAYSSSRGSGVTGGFVNGAAVPAAFYTDFGAQAAGAAVSPNTSGGDGQYGYVVGAGIEYALPPTSFLNVFHSSAVTLKIEGLYFYLGHAGLSNGAQIIGVSNTGAVITGTSTGVRDNDFGLVRAGINFRFDSLQAPVVARY